MLPAARVVKLPAGIDDRTAAAMMLKGMTAEYLLRRTYKVRSGDTVLIHAAAGGDALLVLESQQGTRSLAGDPAAATDRFLAEVWQADTPIGSYKAA